MLFRWKYANIIFYAGISCWIVITILMRIKTLEAFGQKKFLVLLELLGLGFVLDCLCALACIRNESEGMTDAASEKDK